MDISNNVIYLDYNATSPLDCEVYNTICQSLKYSWANPSSSYARGKSAKEQIENARISVATMIKANNSDIVFTSSGTEANANVFHTFATMFSNPKDQLPHIITSCIEHNSVLDTLICMENLKQIELSILPISSETGAINPGDILPLLQSNTVLVSVMLANNETGAIQPIAEISKMLSSYRGELELVNRVYLHTDAAQAIGKINVSVEELSVDYLTIVGHKFYGPRIGALYVRGLGSQEGDSVPLKPMLFGGGQERGYRPGTENTPMIAGLGKAAQLVTRHITEYSQYMATCRDYLEDRLVLRLGEDKVRLLGRFPSGSRLPNTASIAIIDSRCRADTVIALCPGVEVSRGAACHSTNTGDQASSVLTSSGWPASLAINAIRVSVGRGTTCAQIDSFIDMLVSAVETLVVA